MKAQNLLLLLWLAGCGSSTGSAGKSAGVGGATSTGDSAQGGGAGGSVATASAGASAGQSAAGAQGNGAHAGDTGASGASASGGTSNSGFSGGAGGAPSVIIGGSGGSGIGAASGGSAGSAAALLHPGTWGDQADGTFKNPVLWADYNNLDVITAGGAFYMIAASHHFMGMPVLRSADMVNWTLIARIYRKLSVDPRYDQPGQAYQHGTWAPAIRYHDNLFWVYVTTPAEGLLMTTASTPEGPWAPWVVVQKVAGWEDPCPFWDDVENAGGDGPNGTQAYLIRSQTGAGPLIVQPMSWDGTKLLGTPTTVATGPTLEGPKLSKRAGSYYIFAPEGGIDAGYQVVLRAASILGPYQKKTILERGTTAINGPHQGSWIDLPNGDSWFYHFQQDGGWGRVAWLEPAHWGADGWPTIGVDLDGNGIGEPVLQSKKPNVGATFPISAPQSTDEFDGPGLGVQWLWNHNPDDSKWSLADRPGWLRLTARPLATKSGTDGAGGAVRFTEDSLLFAYDTLVQLAMGKVASAVTKLDATGLIDGQRAGLTLFGQVYGWVGVVLQNGQLTIRANNNGTNTAGPVLTGKTVFLKGSIDANSQVSFAYSLDGVTFTALGQKQTVGRTWFEGIKFGLFSYNLSTGTAGGTADFDFFHYTHDGPS